MNIICHLFSARGTAAGIVYCCISIARPSKSKIAVTLKQKFFTEVKKEQDACIAWKTERMCYKLKLVQGYVVPLKKWSGTSFPFTKPVTLLERELGQAFNLCSPAYFYLAVDFCTSFAGLCPFLVDLEYSDDRKDLYSFLCKKAKR